MCSMSSQSEHNGLDTGEYTQGHRFYFLFSSFSLFFFSHPLLLAYCHFAFSRSYMDALKPLANFFHMDCKLHILLEHAALWMWIASHAAFSVLWSWLLKTRTINCLHEQPCRVECPWYGTVSLCVPNSAWCHIMDLMSCGSTHSNREMKLTWDFSPYFGGKSGSLLKEKKKTKRNKVEERRVKWRIIGIAMCGYSIRSVAWIGHSCEGWSHASLCRQTHPSAFFRAE